MIRLLHVVARRLCCLAFALAACAAAHAQINRAPLAPQPFARLPLGSVEARSWLRHQLELQRDGLTGHAEGLYGDIGQSDWVSESKRGGQHAWERGPYYAKGLIALAYVLDDKSLKNKARKWIDAVLASQSEDGDFGPKPRNWWPNMIVLHYVRDYYEATGDERIPPFLEKYFRFQLRALPGHPLAKESGWAKARGGDNLEIVLWLYNRTGEAWLLDLARLVMEQTNEWHKYYAEETGDNWYPNHIVNVMQGLKTPPLMYLVSGEQAHKDAFSLATSPDGWLVKQCGRVDGMVSGTEPLTDRGSTQGTELCAVVERILATTVRDLPQPSFGLCLLPEQLPSRLAQVRPQHVDGNCRPRSGRRRLRSEPRDGRSGQRARGSDDRPGNGLPLPRGIDADDFRGPAGELSFGAANSGLVRPSDGARERDAARER